MNNVRKMSNTGFQVCFEKFKSIKKSNAKKLKCPLNFDADEWNACYDANKLIEKEGWNVIFNDINIDEVVPLEKEKEHIDIQEKQMDIQEIRQSEVEEEEYIDVEEIDLPEEEVVLANSVQLKRNCTYLDSHVSDCKLVRDAALNYDCLAYETLGDFCEEPSPERALGFQIRNIICSFHTNKTLNLKYIAENMRNASVEELNINNYLIMRMWRYDILATFYPQGLVVCSGSKSYKKAKNSARNVLHTLCLTAGKCSFCGFQFEEIISTAYLPWDVDVLKFANDTKDGVILTREPELRAQLTLTDYSEISIFETGAINIKAYAIENVLPAFESVYNFLYKYRKHRNAYDNAVVESLIPYGDGNGGFDLK